MLGVTGQSYLNILATSHCFVEEPLFKGILCELTHFYIKILKKKKELHLLSVLLSRYCLEKCSVYSTGVIL